MNKSDLERGLRREAKKKEAYADRLRGFGGNTTPRKFGRKGKK